MEIAAMVDTLLKCDDKAAAAGPGWAAAAGAPGADVTLPGTEFPPLPVEESSVGEDGYDDEEDVGDVEEDEGEDEGEEGRCSLTVSKLVLMAPMVAALETIIP